MALDTDFVVIGSGFGGSVAAMRLAQRGYSVTVLEAGRRWAPADPDVDFSRGIAASSSAWLDDHTQVQTDRYPKGSDAMGLLSTLLVDGGGKSTAEASVRAHRFVVSVAA
jgi:choline dehydrogenase-like flavoprotein